ncbi:hypothetical protein PbJCM13498_02300 [Prolixibacter bellariivorans]|uniref:Uncharacterized protein n=1 Tax=Prolixibacter bellariivorans TaxID=314319 RepID=A0A5M4AVB3_9BACT|nr:hypothetical protein [Prolixibacter bellariivorans]GET31367.1 hypothetical protein PbJCM13498_02300 [Prolixibacter bellariivorans]
MASENTNFSFGYAELTQRGDHMVYLYTRDKEVFLSLGFSPAYETELASKVQENKDIEPDDYWQGVLKMKRTAEKNSRGALRRSLDMFELRIGLLFGDGSPELQSFRFTATSALKNDELVRYARGLVKTTERYSEIVYTADGMQAFIDGLNADCDDLDNAIDEVKKVVDQRDDASLKRLQKGKELYAMISKICDAGKRYWNGVNEAYYNDYVIYGSSTPLPQPEEEEETPAEGDATDTTSGDEPVA